ncbi:serine/threonine-protein kinase DDB_G0283821-like isoform X2 [Topomyia yanbarensis]|uniref:serine/threonine-protein kinase DDB_G0283821-like isoform X2 n=1 Tax=Topomyia yanbarensis TaxID=2498891 RepID=UPI00273B77D1|nr:serine/threonine-protein kinase DDB_G0283821-like isoform X2 [Topomyia yanbarensis]
MVCGKCQVAGCNNKVEGPNMHNLSFHRFPKDCDTCKQWVEFCNRPELWKKYDENGPEYLYKSSRICSDHFQPSDFNNPNLFSQGLKKGSVPTLYPASKEPRNRYSIGGLSGLRTLGDAVIGGGGGGSSGNNSPPNNNNNNNTSIDSESLMVPMSAKRPLSSHPSVQQPVAKQRRSLPPTLNTSTNNSHAAVSGVLAGLIQRQQLKEQQRKAFAAALQLQHRQQVPNHQQTRSLLASLKQKPNSNNNNNNNNHISSNNNNTSSGKLAAAAQEKLEDERGYGINYVDMDGGDSTEYDAGFQKAVEKELAAYKQLQQMKAVKAAAAVIPASLKSELTVTPAVNHSSATNTNGTSSSGTTLNGTMNYKEKYEQTLKELFACRKIVKNQNNAIKQLQGEIDFLNQLLKEK